MSMIEFLEKHEKLLQGDRGNYRKNLASLKLRLEELQSTQPDYQRIADRINQRLEEEEWRSKINQRLKVGDEVIGIGSDLFGWDIDGLKGRVVCLPTMSNDYAVEWVEEIPGGHECDGKAMYGFGCCVDKNYLKKVDPIQNITSKKDYDDFINDLIDLITNQEYLDMDDYNFEEGDKVEITGVTSGFSIGDRVTLGTHCFIGFHVENEGSEYHIASRNMAKVKKRERELQVGDIIETVDMPLHYGIKDGRRGEIVGFREHDVRVKFPYLVGEDKTIEEKINRIIYCDYLRLVETKEERELKQIINAIESEFDLLEYENRRLELADETLELLYERKISYEDIEDFALDIIADLGLNPGDDKELEDLLK